MITEKDGGSVCHITNWREAESNAKLIAAAPEMFDALVALTASLEGLESSELNSFSQALTIIQEVRN